MKAPLKKSLSEAMHDRLKTLSDARREKEAAERRESFRGVEDEMMQMIAGPEWRTRYPGESQDDEEDEDERQAS